MKRKYSGWDAFIMILMVVGFLTTDKPVLRILYAVMFIATIVKNLRR